MTRFLQDLRYGARLLVKDGAFTFACVATLALGIGANTAIFSVINGILLHPLPYGHPDRLMFLTQWSEQVPEMSFSVENFKDLRDQNRSFESLVASNNTDFVMTGQGDAERLAGRRVTSGLFRTLEVQPIAGRAFTPDEDKVGAEKVALLSEGFWERRFGRRADIVGAKLTLNNNPYTVVGVLPASFHGSWRRAEIFTPLLQEEDRLGGPERRGSHPGIYVIARLKPGVSFEQARGEVVSIAKGLADKYPDSNAKNSMTAEGLQEAIVGDLRPSLLVLLGAVGFVLLIACGNVANLVLGRAASRQREMAVRAAMGATRGRVFRQLLTESLVLGAIGGALGLVLAYWGVSALRAWIPSSIPRVEEVRVDGMVLFFTVAVSLVTGVVFGVAPAWKISGTEPNAVLKAGAQKGGTGRGHQHLRSALVVAEISLALVLLVGAGLMLRSFFQVLNADVGIRPKGVGFTQVSLPLAGYQEPEKIAGFITTALRNIEAVPGIRTVASTLPLLGGWQTSFGIQGRPDAPPGQAPSTDISRVSPAYFRTMGVDLIRGRVFTDQDGPKAPRVCVVDETFAKTYWPNEDPIGRKVRINGRSTDPDAVLLEIVGVVRHVKNYGVDQPSRVETYLPYMQDPISSFTIVFQSDRDEADTIAAVRKAVKDVDAAVPIFSTGTLDTVIDDSRAPRRLSALLLTVFAGLALLLAAVGIYGVISYNVAQRTQEIGIRMALGAERGRILRMVLGQGTGMAILGVAIGLTVALMLTRLIAALLFQVSPTDPPTFSVVPAILFAVAVAAAYLPARRATRVEPMVALRE
ncbi:MAG: ABC transporter permease [Acidobacteria bacterium]|nr:ABC transporter permease [Acidobacteriota bacterium]